MATTRNRNRILCDLNNPFATLVDLIASGTDTQPRFARGYDCQFEIGLAELAALQTAIGHIASVTIEIKRPRAGQYAPTDEDPVLMEATVAAADLNAALTVNAWESGAEADAHALVSFSNGETANCPAGKLWMVVYALTTDAEARRIVYAANLIDCEETGAPSDTEPEAPVASYFTAAQSDARYLQQAPVDANFRVKGGNTLQIRETSPTAGFRTVWLEGGALKFGVLDES